MKTHYIVLNGKRYDATTGALLDTAAATDVTNGFAAPSPKKTIDNTVHTQNLAAQKSIPPKNPSQKSETIKTRARATIKPTPAKTFSTIKNQYPIHNNYPASTLIPKKLSINSVSTTRLKRATTTPKSSKIGHFSAQPIMPIRPQIVPIQVVQAPVQNHATSDHRKNTHKPQKEINIFKQALASAKSHENTYRPYVAKKSSKKYLMAFGIVALIACTTLLGLSYRHNIEAQVASIRAGFSVSSPSFVPSGFKQQTTAVEGKSVSINYVSPQDQTKYSLTQESSDWNSSSLLASVAAKSGNSYRVIINAGRTIFIYDQNKATWVDDGILYSISGNAPLTTDQITSIASSL